MLLRVRPSMVWVVALSLLASAHSTLSAQPRSDVSLPVLHDLHAIGDLQTVFDQETDKIRLVMLLSPTWPACVTAARWAQQDILRQYPEARLRVYAVWFNMYPGDSRSKWPAEVLPDQRVIHYWDEQRVVGEHYLHQLGTFVTRRASATMPPVADALWDAVFLHDSGERWGEPVPLPRIWGYPIMVTRAEVLDELQRIIK